MDVETRLVRLEREARVWRVLAALVVAGALMGAGQSTQLRGTSLVIESSPGAGDGVLITADAERGGSLHLTDPKGTSRVILGKVANPNRYGVEVWGHNAVTWITSGEEETSVQVISGGNLDSKSVLASTSRGSGLSVNYKGESTALGLND